MKALVTILIVALLVAGCNGNMTASVMTGQKTDLDVKVGASLEAEDGGRTVAGVVVKYLKSDDIEWGPGPDVIGGFVKFYLTQDITIEDTLEPSLIQPWLEALHAQPYAGLELVGNARHSARHVQPNWILGTAFTLSEDGNISLNIEYIDGDQAAGDVYLGMGYKF